VPVFAAVLDFSSSTLVGRAGKNSPVEQASVMKACTTVFSSRKTCRASVSDESVRGKGIVTCAERSADQNRKSAALHLNAYTPTLSRKISCKQEAISGSVVPIAGRGSYKNLSGWPPLQRAPPPLVQL